MAWDFDTHLRTGKQAAVLRVRDLTVRIQTEEALVLPVDRVSFDLEHGEALGLIGESGSGKTTVALSLLRLLPPGASVSGRVELAGEDLLASDPARVRRVRGRRIAIDRGLEVTGSLGVLAEAKARGLIPRCQPVLNDMIRVAGFWIGDDLRSRYLRGLNETD